MSLVTSWCRPTRNRRSRCVGCLHCVKKCCCPSPRGFSRHFLLLSRTTSYAVFRYLFFSKYYFKVFPGVGLYFLLLLSKFLLASKLWFLRTKIIIYWYIYIYFFKYSLLSSRLRISWHWFWKITLDWMLYKFSFLIYFSRILGVSCSFFGKKQFHYRSVSYCPWFFLQNFFFPLFLLSFFPLTPLFIFIAFIG